MLASPTSTRRRRRAGARCVTWKARTRGTWLLIYDGVESAAALEGLLPAQPRPRTDSRRNAVTDPAESTTCRRSHPVPQARCSPISAPRPAEAVEIATDPQGNTAGHPAGGRVDRRRARSAARQRHHARDGHQQRGGGLSPRLAAPGSPAAGHRDTAPVDGRAAYRPAAAADRAAYDDAAMLLLETCAFLAPTGMSRRLLRSPRDAPSARARRITGSATRSWCTTCCAPWSGYGFTCPRRACRLIHCASTGGSWSCSGTARCATREARAAGGYPDAGRERPDRDADDDVIGERQSTPSSPHIEPSGRAAATRRRGAAVAG